nr:S8 family serine peptidase [uncultured Limnohabitans sp.]
MHFSFNSSKTPSQLSLIATLCATTALLTGCGGGGSEPQAQNETLNAAANAALTFDSATVTTDNGTTTFEALTKKLEYGAKAHLSDVGVIDGATGQGVTIMVIDDFSPTLTATVSFPNIQRKLTYREGINSYAAIYKLSYEMPIEFSHGQLVSDIAGGTRTSETLLRTLTNVAPSNADLIACTITAETLKLTCPNTFQTSAPISTLNATLTVQAIPGVAAQATVLQRKVDLSASQDIATTWASIHGHLRSSVGSTVPSAINLSLGSDIPTSGKSAAEVLALIEKFPLTQMSDAVITVAAGNSGAPCNDNDLNGCNSMAVAMAAQPETRDTTLVVGALTGAAGAQKMALYSTSAGFLADRYILASGDTGLAANVQGTSFAAPRVAGVAAILKQKYPKLTAADIANIILQSANKDMNNDGNPDFTGVDPIFGHGKLSLENALKLAASIP